MNPIIINLLAKEEQAELARARDPVRLLIAISTWLLVVVVAVGGILSGLTLRSRAEMNVLELKWRELEKQQTSGPVYAYRALRQGTDDLLEINKSRRLMAPQLAMIKDLIPDYVQLTRLNLAILSIARAPVAPPPEGMDDIKARIASRAPPATQLLVLQLDGKVVSPHPEEDMANFRRSLETNATFGAQIQQVKLRSYGRISTPAERGGPVIGQFALECQYKERP